MCIRNASALLLVSFAFAITVTHAEPAVPDGQPKTDREKVAIEQERIKAQFTKVVENLTSIAQKLEKSVREEDIQRAKVVFSALDEAKKRRIGEKMEGLCQLLAKDRLVGYKKSITDAETVMRDLRAFSEHLNKDPEKPKPKHRVPEQPTSKESALEIAPRVTNSCADLEELTEAQGKLIPKIESLYKDLMEREHKDSSL